MGVIMLILTRYPGDSVIIGDLEVTVKVLEIKAGNVVLGFDAEPNISILRKELLNKPKPTRKESTVCSAVA